MSDDALRRAYREGLPTLAGRSGCPAPEAIAALVSRNGDETERLAVLDHVMLCEACRRDFELLRATQNSMPEGAPNRARTLALAASVVLALGAGTWMLRGGSGRPTVDSVRGGADGFALVSPAPGAETARPLFLRWHRVAGARSYTVELLAEDGTPVRIWSTQDTALVVADSIPLDRGRPYAWWVRALLADGGEARSRVARFTLR
jgi:hypothetical protein